MEAWKDEPRVRPIPIDDDTSSAFDTVGGSEPPEPQRRPWLPVALAAVGVAVVVGSVTSFGALRDEPRSADDILSQISSTTLLDDHPVPVSTTQPVRSLEATIPGFDTRLTLVARGPDGDLVALRWDPSFAQPKAFPIVFNEEHTARFVATEASFDASGGFVAITGYDVASQAPWVWAGVPDDVAAVDLAAARSPVWHSTDVGYLAWLATVGDDLMLRTGRMNPLSRMLREVADVTSVPEGSQLVRWDSAGFVVNAGQDGTIVLDSHGSEVWTHPGRTVSASHDTIMLADGTRPDTTEGPDEIMATVYTFSRTGEEGARFIDSEPPAPLQTHRSGWISSATDLTARVDVIDQSTSLEVTGSAMATIRKLKIADDVLPAGFIHNDAFFVFRADAGNDLIFVNWNVGSSHVLPIPDQYSIIGFGTG